MDQQCIPLPWRDVKTPKPSKLTIGIVFDDGICKPHPPIVRALKEVEAKLEASGVNVIIWEPHRVYEAIEVAYELLTSDGGYCALDKLGEAGEPTLRLTDFVLGATKGDQTLDSLEIGFYASTRETLRAEYLRLFNERKVDFLLTPTYVGTGGKPETAEYIGYTILWNVLDYTALTLPTGIYCNKEKDLKDESYKPRNEYEL
jgi:amidase